MSLLITHDMVFDPMEIVKKLAKLVAAADRGKYFSALTGDLIDFKAFGYLKIEDLDNIRFNLW